MGITDRLKKSFRQLLQRPGATVSLAPYEALIGDIEDRETEIRGWSDAQLTSAARAMLPGVDERSEAADIDDAEAGALAAALTRDEIIEVCALGREAGRRALGERAFDVQLFGAMAMLDGRVAEMATGEGKTLAAAIAAFGHVVRGSRVHVLTVNDYLARRDATWMGPVYELLGLTVGSGRRRQHPRRARRGVRMRRHVRIDQ